MSSGVTLALNAGGRADGEGGSVANPASSQVGEFDSNRLCTNVIDQDRMSTERHRDAYGNFRNFGNQNGKTK